MTSANVTHYELYDDNMELIVTDSQHAMCKDRISEVLEQWEKDYPDALLCIRWPDECEVDHYLSFERLSGYTEGFVDGVFMDEDDDTITLRAFMRKRRLNEIAQQDRTIEYFRDRLREHTGNQCLGDAGYKRRQEYVVFKRESEDHATSIGSNVKAYCYIDEDGKFRRSYSVRTRTVKEATIANEAIKDYLATGLDNLS